MLGLEPVGDHLVIDPSLPQGIGRLELLDIPGRWGRIDAFGRGRVEIQRSSACGQSWATRPAATRHRRGRDVRDAGASRPAEVAGWTVDLARVQFGTVRLTEDAR